MKYIVIDTICLLVLKGISITTCLVIFFVSQLLVELVWNQET
jgi:hypothetical protein